MTEVPPPGPPTRRWRNFLLAILAAGLLLRVAAWRALAAHDPGPLEPDLDALVFLRWAARIAGGDLAGEGAFFFNPLYAYFLAPLVAVFGDAPLAALRVVQLLLGLATVLLVADGARRLLDENVSLLAAALAAAWPLLLFYGPVVHGVTLGVFLGALSLWTLARFAASRTAAAAFLAGIPLGLAVLARPNVLPFALLLPAWFALLAPAGSRLRFAAARGGLLLAGVALCLLPSLLRNVAVLGRPVLTTTSMGINLHLCNNPAAWDSGAMQTREFPFTPGTLEADSRAVAERAEGRTLGPTEVSDWWTGRAAADVAAAPGRALLFTARKLLYFFAGFEIPSSYYFDAWRAETPVLRILPLSFALLAPFLAVGVLAAFRRTGAVPFAMLVAVYAGGLAIFLPLDHYRAPVLPAAFPLAALGAAEAWRAWRSPSQRGRGRVAAALAVGLLLGFGNRIAGAVGIASLGAPGNDLVFHHVTRALGQLARGPAGLAEAERRARLAVEADDGRSPDAWIARSVLAEVALARGDAEGEARELEEALRRRPGEPGLLLRSGRNLLRRGRGGEGLAALERAVAAAPRPAHHPGSRAAGHYQMGRVEGGLVHLEAAAAADPSRVSCIADQALMLRRLGRPGEAMARLDAALAGAPREVPLLLERARLLLGMGDRPGAAAALRAAVEAGAPVPSDLLGLRGE